ncbi:MAG: SGNH/GDSL hydrolase family protein [Ginsengibacter sp.]
MNKIFIVIYFFLVSIASGSAVQYSGIYICRLLPPVTRPLAWPIPGDLKKQITSTTKGACIGNSTVAKYKGGEAVASLLFSAEEIALGYSCYSLAVPGHTINQQLNAWNGFAEKKQMDWIIVEIGLNDLDPSDPTGSALDRYQKLIDTINLTKKAGARVILATMTPCKERLVDIYKDKWKVSYNKWREMNYAIMGNHRKNIIMGVDFRFNGHTMALNDGNGNLKSVYETSRNDHIHENTAGRMIIASYWRLALSANNLL